MIKSSLKYSIFYSHYLLYLCCSKMFRLWKKYSLIKAMCQRWPAICSQFAVQSRSYCNCYEFEAKILVKNKWKKLHFSLMLMAVTSEFKEGFLKSGAQTLLNPWLSADYAVILVRFPHSPLSVPCFSFLDLPCPFSVLCWSNILLLLWYNSGQFKQRFPKTS